MENAVVIARWIISSIYGNFIMEPITTSRYRGDIMIIEGQPKEPVANRRSLWQTEGACGKPKEPVANRRSLWQTEGARGKPKGLTKRIRLGSERGRGATRASKTFEGSSPCMKHRRYTDGDGTLLLFSIPSCSAYVLDTSAQPRGEPPSCFHLVFFLIFIEVIIRDYGD
jgi:hypothetical protein